MGIRPKPYPHLPLWLRRTAYVLAWLGGVLFFGTVVGDMILTQLQPMASSRGHMVLVFEFQEPHYLTPAYVHICSLLLWIAIGLLVLPTYLCARTGKFVSWDDL